MSLARKANVAVGAGADVAQNAARGLNRASLGAASNAADLSRSTLSSNLLSAASRRMDDAADAVGTAAARQGGDAADAFGTAASRNINIFNISQPAGTAASSGKRVGRRVKRGVQAAGVAGLGGYFLFQSNRNRDRQRGCRERCLPQNWEAVQERGEAPIFAEEDVDPRCDNVNTCEDHCQRACENKHPTTVLGVGANAVSNVWNGAGRSFVEDFLGIRLPDLGFLGGFSGAMRLLLGLIVVYYLIRWWPFSSSESSASSKITISMAEPRQGANDSNNVPQPQYIPQPWMQQMQPFPQYSEMQQMQSSYPPQSFPPQLYPPQSFPPQLYPPQPVTQSSGVSQAVPE